MQRILTEGALRSELIMEGTREYSVQEDTIVTPAALEYLKKKGIKLKTVSAGEAKNLQTMSRTVIKNQGINTYIDARTGQGYREKPEEMTHLRGNLLVPKTDPRIVFRGKLDSLEADLLKGQAMADRLCDRELCEALREVLEHIRLVLGAEVKDAPLAEKKLFGYSHEDLRRVSHHVKEEIGIDHPIPDYRMGEAALELNWLRTRIREAELAAAAAFAASVEAGRPDIIEEMNRLSSGIYILFCREVAKSREGKR